MGTYLEFEVELRDIKPRIWRRFLLRSPGTFFDLHCAIQALGWFDCHLWLFGHTFQDVIATVAEADPDADAPDACDVPLSRHFKKSGDRCLYVYDYGDDWQHEVTFRGRRTRESSAPRILLAGERALPPEDAGGVAGYERLVEALATGKDPYGEDIEELLSWVGDWRPETFDLATEGLSFEKDHPQEF